MTNIEANWDEFDYELADQLIEQETPCNMECTVKGGHFYCTATDERCMHGIFDMSRRAPKEKDNGRISPLALTEVDNG